MRRIYAISLMAILCLWSVYFLGAWDKDKPASSTSLRSSNPEMLANQSALETALTQDHEFSTGGTNSGEHKQIKFNAPISTPTNAANKSWLYEKDVSAVVELHWLDEVGNELQMSSGGDLFSSTGLVVTGTSTFNGSITLGAGDDLIGSSTSDITMNTNKFTVAGATGNTVIAGTCDITGATEVTGIATLGDASLLKTSAAPTTDAMIANKKYIDDQVAALVLPSGLTGSNNSSGETTIGDLEIKWGIVTNVANDGSVTFTDLSGISSAFSNACFQVIACEGRDTTNSSETQIDAISTTGFGFDVGGATTDIRFFAIGR